MAKKSMEMNFLSVLSFRFTRSIPIKKIIFLKAYFVPIIHLFVYLLFLCKKIVEITVYRFSQI